jgi:hypothetical protein
MISNEFVGSAAEPIHSRSAAREAAHLLHTSCGESTENGNARQPKPPQLSFRAVLVPVLCFYCPAFALCPALWQRRTRRVPCKVWQGQLGNGRRKSPAVVCPRCHPPLCSHADAWRPPPRLHLLVTPGRVRTALTHSKQRTGSLSTRHRFAPPSFRLRFASPFLRLSLPLAIPRAKRRAPAAALASRMMRPPEIHAER